MSASRWKYATAVVVGVVAVSFAACRNSAVMTGPKLTLTIEATGGFAYVSPESGDNHLNIAYLKSWRQEAELDATHAGLEVACDVQQIGTTMKLIVGDIVDHEPNLKQLPGDRKFNLDKAIVQFPALEAANLPLTIVRSRFIDAPLEPADTENPAEWKKNLKWIPSIKEYHNRNGGTAVIRPDWKDQVNGRMQLRGGEIVATTPSIQKFKKAKFDFKQGNASFKVSATDKSIYTVEIPMSSLPNGNLEITLSNGSEGFTKLVIKPRGNKVELQLTGEHDAHAPDLNNGDPLADFCTFYQLLHPMPDPKDFVVPYYIKAPALASTPPNTNVLTGYGQPSPGIYCIGDWF